MNPKLKEINPLSNYRLRLRYDDGVEGEVDLSSLAGRGVFAAWNEPGAFERVNIGSGGEVTWEAGVDLCPDALYMQLTGKSPEQLFPSLARTGTHA